MKDTGNTQWQVLRSGKVWTNYIDSEEDCIQHIKLSIAEGNGISSEYTFEQMSDDKEIPPYQGNFKVDLREIPVLGEEAYARKIVEMLPAGEEGQVEGRCVYCTKFHNYWCGQNPHDYCITNITEWLKQELAKPLE